MTIGDTRPFIDRNYRDITVPGQWLRETFRNAEEAKADHVHFGVEWQGVEALGVYRRYIADDGAGMNEDDLTAFMLTYGGGGKPIGTEHENFGIGAKVALLPWNTAGLVVISYKDGNGYAMLLRGDDREYGAVTWEAEDDAGDFVLTAVIDPDGVSLGEFGIADLGSIWQQVPFWQGGESPPDHGTIFLLLGPEAEYDSLAGDPNRAEESATHIQALYLNSRLWELPNGPRVTIDLPVSRSKNTWAKTNPGQIESGPGTGGFTRRVVSGARWHVDRGGRLATVSGSVDLGDGTVADWWLRTEPPESRPNPYGPRAGFIAVLYRGELYDIARAEDSKWRYRQFGIPAAEVMSNAFIVIRPSEDGPEGIYPTGGRDRLLRRGARDLPFTEWGAAFLADMPPEIADAIEKAMPKELLADSSWKEKFAERFWNRLHALRLRVRTKGDPSASDPTQTTSRVIVPSTTPGPGNTRPKRPKVPGSQPRTPDLSVTDTGGANPARRTEMESSIPSWRPVAASEMDDEFNLASWNPDEVNPDGSKGCVLLNKDHPGIVSLVEEMARAYSVTPQQVATWQEVERTVWDVVGQALVGKVVHTQAMLQSEVDKTTLRNLYLSDAALTTAGLGMVAEQQVVSTVLGGKIGRRKTA